MADTRENIIDDKQTPQYIKDRIIDDDITELLSDREYFAKPMPGDKYNLSVHEAKFVDGIKKSPSASKELKKAYKDKFISESETLTKRDGNLSLLGTYFDHSKYILITIPGIVGQYVLAISDLKSLLKEGAFGIAFKMSGDETAFIIETIDKRVLMNHCMKWD